MSGGSKDHTKQGRRMTKVKTLVRAMFLVFVMGVMGHAAKADCVITSDLHGNELVSFGGQINDPATTVVPGTLSSLGEEIRFDITSPIPASFQDGPSATVLVLPSTPTPEPSSLLLMALGLSALGIYKVRSRVRA